MNRAPAQPVGIRGAPLHAMREPAAVAAAGRPCYPAAGPGEGAAADETGWNGRHSSSMW